MDKRILLPTDFSKNSLNAIHYAMELYATRKCTFYLLHVYQVSGFSIDGAAYRPQPGERAYELEQQKTDEAFAKLLAMIKLRPENPNHTFETLGSNLPLYEAAQEAIAKEDMDMVIMGTKGMTGARTVIFGTNTMNMMEDLDCCPVLAIPENLGFGPLEEVVFPTDFKTPFKRRKLKYMLHIAEMHGLTIRVLHVGKLDRLNAAQQTNKALLGRILQNYAHDYCEVQHKVAQKGIQEFMKGRKKAIIAFMHQKPSFFKRLFSKPLVQELGYHSEVPVLVLRDTAS
ncbi:universal stress protein [Maribacter sp. 2307ULW6-5]